jgi:hypothetical protein
MALSAWSYMLLDGADMVTQTSQVYPEAIMTSFVITDEGARDSNHVYLPPNQWVAWRR